MVVFDPLKVVLTNYPDKEEVLKSEDNPEDAETTIRDVPFSRELYIEREDFMENPPKKFFRLSPGQKVRLKSAYIIQCDEVIKDASGAIRGTSVFLFAGKQERWRTGEYESTGDHPLGQHSSCGYGGGEAI